jgi:beta-N-acetylhexosaminidase
VAAVHGADSALGRLAGGLLCVGIPGPHVEPELAERLRALAPGGVVLFARNVTTPEATRALTRQLAAVLGDTLPPSLCVDQEGGRVARVPREVPLPSMLALGAANDAALAERAGAALASTLRAVGANVDFAPVLDLALDGRSTVVGTRSLGDDAERVAELGAALVRGLQSGGVAATPKHFPGHGATPADSHVSLPVVETDHATLRFREWLPFASAFAAGARAVMSAHVLVPALDPDVPATLSPRILRDVLRGELGFTGVCFTDCLEMEGVAARFGTARAGVMALAAGADALLVSHDLARAEAVRDAIVAAVTAGELPLARVEEAAARVAALRRGHMTWSRSSTVDADAVDADADAVAREIACRAIVRLRGELVLVPERPVTIVSFEGAASDGIATAVAERPSLNLALRRRRVRSELLRVPLRPQAEMLETLLDVLRGQAARSLVVLTRRAHLHPAQREGVSALLAAVPEALVVSMLEPFDAACFPQARHLACCFSDEVTSIEALADVLAGRNVASGRLPVRLDYSFA